MNHHDFFFFFFLPYSYRGHATTAGFMRVYLSMWPQIPKPKYYGSQYLAIISLPTQKERVREDGTLIPVSLPE